MASARQDRENREATDSMARQGREDRATRRPSFKKKRTCDSAHVLHQRLLVSSRWPKLGSFTPQSSHIFRFLPQSSHIFCC